MGALSALSPVLGTTLKIARQYTQSVVDTFEVRPLLDIVRRSGLQTASRLLSVLWFRSWCFYRGRAPRLVRMPSPLRTHIFHWLMIKKQNRSSLAEKRLDFR
jgi:hypothetical protein